MVINIVMLNEIDVLFCAVALATLLTVQARISTSSNIMEREDMCDKNLAEVCEIPQIDASFYLRSNEEVFDEYCKKQRKSFDCYKNYDKTCKPKDFDSRYFITVVDICDGLTSFSKNVKTSLKCMKKAEYRYFYFCSLPALILATRLKNFSHQAKDLGISVNDYGRLATGLFASFEVFCFARQLRVCNNVEIAKVHGELLKKIGEQFDKDYLENHKDLVKKVWNNVDMSDINLRWKEITEKRFINKN